MHIFSVVFSKKTIYKNLLWIYFICVVMLGYTMMMEQVPDHIYVTEGSNIEGQLGTTYSLRDVLEDRTVYESLSNNDGPYKKSESRVCYLYNVIPLKTVQVSVVSPKEIYASGKTIGIYEKTSGVLVLDSGVVKDEYGDECIPAKGLLEKGDYITRINGDGIRNKKQLIDKLNYYGERNYKIILTVLRKGSLVDIEISPIKDKTGRYMIGAWVKDDMAGIGTITYCDKNRKFGALGHGINEDITGELLNIMNGGIYNMDITGITKGKRGCPGEIAGVVHYGRKNHIGTVENNSKLGISGTIDESIFHEFERTKYLYPVAYKQDINTGKAFVLSDISGRMEKYTVQIEDVYYNVSDTNKCMQIKVTDKRLIDQTGGIVQGMSGSSIIQNGKIIGAVTHVFVDDPTRGYGIFIEEML